MQVLTRLLGGNLRGNTAATACMSARHQHWSQRDIYNSLLSIYDPFLKYHIIQQRLQKPNIIVGYSYKYIRTKPISISTIDRSQKGISLSNLNKPPHLNNSLQPKSNFTQSHKPCLPQTGNSTSSTNSSLAPPDPPALHHHNQEPHRLLAGP